MCATQVLPIRVGPFTFRYQGNGATPRQLIDTTRKAIDCATTLPLTVFIMKLCSRLFVLHCRSRPKYDNSRHFDPHFEEGRGGVEPWRMARWKARAEFLLSVIELLFLSLRLRRYKAKRVKTHCFSERVGQFEPRFQGEGVIFHIFLVSRKL